MPFLRSPAPRPSSWLQIILAAAALLMAMIGAAAAQATSRDVRMSVDPATGAFAIAGWTRQTANTGTIFYICQEESCGKGSTISMRRQPQSTPLDAETLRQNELRTSAMMQERLKGKVERVDVGEPRVTRDNAFAVGEISRTFIPAAGADVGLQLYWKSGFVADAQSMHTLSSSADTRALCDSNFEMFKFALMLANKKQ